MSELKSKSDSDKTIKDFNPNIQKSKDNLSKHLKLTLALENSKVKRMKSIDSIGIRSPIIALTPNDETISLHTSKTQNSNRSRMHNMPSLWTRNYYNDFTTIDWTDAFIKSNKFQYELHHKQWIDSGASHGGNGGSSTAHGEAQDARIPLYHRAYLTIGRWVLIVLIGFVFAVVAFGIDKFEVFLVGVKHGYCSTNWISDQVRCCSEAGSSPGSGSGSGSGLVGPDPGLVFLNEQCPQWISWSTFFQYSFLGQYVPVDFIIYVVLTVSLASIACGITLMTKISTRISVDPEQDDDSEVSGDLGLISTHEETKGTRKTMYTAAGSGVPEVKTILSGFVIRRFLGTHTFITKTIALVLAIASGMSLGKEGPYVHLATAVGNILSRFFPFVTSNDLIQKQILSAAALSGVALAFGSPLGAVLFILEEINHSLPSFQLFQIFFCAITSTLFLKFLNPYGTGKTVLFELKYTSDWESIELLFFIIIGLAGGIFGACFVKFVGYWPKKFRQNKLIKDHPLFEVVLIALLTGVITFWNPYTRQATTELVLDLATPCLSDELDRSLCPTNSSEYSQETLALLFALIIKIVLTFITFGLKLPMGIYIPSMVIGALFGRLFATILEWINFTLQLNAEEFAHGVNFLCYKEGNCFDKGIYAMIGAGAFMAGVTRMNITLVTILFEITSSYTYVLPFSISVAVANWMGNLIEPNSLYESLLISNDYPFMSPETEAIDPFKVAGEIIEDSVKYQEKPDITSKPSFLMTTSGISSPAVTSRGNTSQYVRTTLSNMMNDEPDSKLYLDITNSPYVSLSKLREKMLLLADKSMIDGCIALVKNRVCIGLIFFPELEICIDKLDEFCDKFDIEDEFFCRMAPEEDYTNVPLGLVKEPAKFNINVLKNVPGVMNQLGELDYFNYGSTTDIERELSDKLRSDMTILTDFTQHIKTNPIFLNHDSELSLAHLVFDKVGNRVIVLLKNGQYYGVLHKKTLIDFIRQAES